MTDETPRTRCVKCGGYADRAGSMACRCRCLFPNGGCSAPIYFLNNANENRQPFDRDGTPHHATCRAYIAEKEAATRCPACSGRRRRNQPCPHCGWSPQGRPPDFTVPTLERFGGGGDGAA